MRTAPFRSGLTLVELLVVVAVLASMLGVLLPALTQARDVASQVQCMDHMRQIGIAMQSAARRYDGRFPPARSLSSPLLGSTDDPTLPVMLVRELGATTLAFQCPGDNGYLYPIAGISYSYNELLGRRPINAASSNPSPSMLPVLWDADDQIFLTTTGELTVPQFHATRNYLYADWHIGDAAYGNTVGRN